LKVVQVVQEFPLYLFVIVIAASVLVVVAIVLMVYFLYIRPKRRGF
jgi:preprotein translocase subunit YajC